MLFAGSAIQCSAMRCRNRLTVRPSGRLRRRLTQALGGCKTTLQTEMLMDQDYQLTISPLCQSITDKGHTVRIDIYRGPDTAWTLEVVDVSNNSTVWDDLFVTDQAALDEGLRTIREEGIESLIRPSSAGTW
jgi:hypothetical protein